jgi:hypothetical protein
VIGIEPSGGPLFVCSNHQKQGVLDHIDRYSGLSHPPPHHFDYFTISTLGELIKYGDSSGLPGGTMDPEERLWVLDLACAAFLSLPEDTDYLVLQSGTDWCHSINFFFHGGVVGVELNPRHWDPCTVCRNEPLPPIAVGALERLGFSGGELGTNFSLDGLPPRATDLAWFVERLFRAAYNEQPYFAVGVRFRHGDVAQAFLAARLRPGWPSESGELP